MAPDSSRDEQWRPLILDVISSAVQLSLCGAGASRQVVSVYH